MTDGGDLLPTCAGHTSKVPGSPHSEGALLLGLDIGTQGAKAVVYDPATRAVLARGTESYDILPSDVPGRAEQDPEMWYQAALRCANTAFASVDRSRVRAIGVSGQQHGLVVLDEAGKVLRPAKLWCDVESAGEATELSRLFEFTTPAGFTASKILWLKRNEPEIFAAVRHILLPAGYINLRLTGTYGCDCGDASGSGVWDNHLRQFDVAQMCAIDPGLPSSMPRLLEPREVLGTLLPAVAEALGLSQDVVVSAGSGDNAMSGLGAGAVEVGDCVISLGTSGTLFGTSDSALVDPSGTVAPFCDATGRWLPLICTQNCTNLTEEVRVGFNLSHGAITDLAENESAGCGGLTMLPYLTGARTPNWPAASACLVGGRPGFMRPGLLYRAAMEGATFSLLAGYDRMQKLGFVAKEIRLVGGGSSNRVWRQMVADVFQLPVFLLSQLDAAAVGAALQAGAAYGSTDVAEYVKRCGPTLSNEVIKPDLQRVAAYEEAYQRHLSLGKQLFGPQ